MECTCGHSMEEHLEIIDTFFYGKILAVRKCKSCACPYFVPPGGLSMGPRTEEVV